MRQQRKEEQDDADAQQHRGAEPPPEVLVHVARGHADDHREQQQGQRVGDDRAADGDRDGLVARDAELADDGIGYKGLGGEESGKQDRGVDGESHNVITCQNAERERYAEGVESEDETAPAAFFEVGRIHVQSRKKHDVEQAGGPRKDDLVSNYHFCFLIKYMKSCNIHSEFNFITWTSCCSRINLSCTCNITDFIVKVNFSTK